MLCISVTTPVASYAPPWLAGWLAGGIYIRGEGAQATQITRFRKGNQRSARANMCDIIMLRRVYGDDAATATVVRNILAPVAGLQLDAPDLHRRCVLVEHIDKFKDALAEFAPFGAVEAVATWSHLGVFVFEAAAGAALALQDPARKPIGRCKAVPPLHLAAAYRFIPSAEIKVSGSAVASPPEPEPTMEAWALAFRELCELKPMIEYHDPATEVCRGIIVRGTPGSKRFVPSADSLVHGPTMGSDGHLWMHGNVITSHVGGIDVQSMSVRVTQEQVSSTKIRVTPLTPIVYVPRQDDNKFY